MIETSRRSFVKGLIAFGVTAPAIVKAGSLMPVKNMIEVPDIVTGWDLGSGDYTVVTAVQPMLDHIALLWSVHREGGESDSELREKITKRILKNSPSLSLENDSVILDGLSPSNGVKREVLKIAAIKNGTLNVGDKITWR